MNSRDRLFLTSIVILAAGLAAAALIYFNAGEETADATDQILSSKMYARQLQLYGGKASVLFDETMRWFGGLWRGKKLALTVGLLSAIASGVVFLCALRGDAEDPPGPEDDASS